MNTSPLDALLMKLSSGDALSAEQVFVAYEPYLRKIVRRRLPTKLRAKFDSTDIVQSIWVDLLREVREGELHFTDANHLRAFLIRVTCNRFNDRFRRNRLALEKERPLTGAEGDVFAASHQATPSDIVQAEDLWDKLLGLCQPGHREILMLKRQGCDYAEIAAKTGGRFHPLEAPAVADERALRRAVRPTTAIFDEVSLALVGIGARPDAAGHMLVHVFDDAGRIVSAERSIALSVAQLRRTRVVAVAGGPAKHRAVLGALRTKLVDVLVTDAGCARFALA